MPFRYEEILPLDWMEQVHIPVRFSVHTESWIQKGILDNKSIYEIVHSVAFVVMRFTIKPKLKELNVMCKSLVAKYPSLKDWSDSTYVSTDCHTLGV